ncbi:hypothetical protein JW911_00305 [Candidatus Peregrinibacteria bacterium]|nr:hypothetical protein [Candidatus Peregrinibacteria bacterium]
MIDEDILRKRYGKKTMKKRTTLSQEVRRAIIWLFFGLILITVALSVVFLLNTSNSAQKGYIHSQLQLQNAELEAINKELRLKILQARSILHLESTDKIDVMINPEKTTFITN